MIPAPVSTTRRWCSVLLVPVVLLVSCQQARRSPARPNILLILADDLGYGDCRAYNADSKIALPNLERLAREGMRFTDAHSPAAVCAPSRYSLITGNYPWRGRHVNGVWKAYGKPQVLPGQMTLAELLRRAGYLTGKVGKHHLGGLFRNKDGPGSARRPEQMDYSLPFDGGARDQGFDFSFVMPCGIQDPPYAFFRNDQLEGDPAALRYWEKGLYGNSEVMHPGVGAPDWDSSEAGPRVFDEALGFVRAHHQRNLSAGTATPFFLYYSAIEAHWPWTPAESLRGHPVRGVTGLSPRADLIYQLDLVIGELVAELERLELADDTLIIVTSDNGGDIGTTEPGKGHSAVGPLLGGKGLIAEGGHRVPLVVRWGDGTRNGSRVPPGTVSSQIVGLHDLVATLVELVGETLPPEQAVDSFSFLPVLLGHQLDSPAVRDHLILQDGRGPNFALREGAWKLVLDRRGEARGLWRLDASGVEHDAAEELSEPDYDSRVTAMTQRFAELRAAPRTAPAAPLP